MGLLYSIIYLLTVNHAIAANYQEHEKSANHSVLKQMKDTTQIDKINQIALPDLSLKYELQDSKQKVEWLMDRKANSIATFNSASQQGEVWSLNKYGDIEHNRVFVLDKTIVDYTNGQLKTLDKLQQWNQLVSVYDPKQISKLSKAGEKVLFGKAVSIYEGLLNGLPTIIWWISDMKIPAYVQLGEGNSRTSMTLKEVYTQTPSNWKWVDPSNLLNYARIDASDFGDMENDPFVKKLLELEGHYH